jgi:hypothetical protein
MISHEVGCQFRQAIIAIRRPAVIDRHVPAHDVPDFAQALAEGSREIFQGVSRPATEIAHDRYGLLLRARRERPGHRTGGHSMNKMTSPHCFPNGRERRRWQ